MALIAQHTIKLPGGYVKPGSEISLSIEEAAVLIASGAVKKTEDNPPAIQRTKKRAKSKEQ